VRNETVHLHLLAVLRFPGRGITEEILPLGALAEISACLEPIAER